MVLRVGGNLLASLQRKFPSMRTTLNKHGDAHTSWHCAGLRVSAPHTLLNLKSFVLFAVNLLSRGGAVKLATNTFLEFMFWAKFFSSWCNTLEWRSLYLHFPVQQRLVYVLWFNGTCKKGFWSQLFSSDFPRATTLFIKLSHLL